MQVNTNATLLEAVSKIEANKINLSDVAYIGDDINCMYVLEKVGIKACPNNAHKVKNLKGILPIKKWW